MVSKNFYTLFAVLVLLIVAEVFEGDGTVPRLAEGVVDAPPAEEHEKPSIILPPPSVAVNVPVASAPATPAPELEPVFSVPAVRIE